MGNGTAIPWPAWFAHAVTALGLTPADFWALSVCEWRWLAGGALGIEPDRAMTRAAFNRLCREYPDQRHGQ